MVSSVQGGKIVWCPLSTVAKLSGVFCQRWQKNVVSFVHPGKNSLVSFGSGVLCSTFKIAVFTPKTVFFFFFEHLSSHQYGVK